MVSSFNPLALAALPGLVAVGIWAVTDLPRFVAIGVLCAMILPMALVEPGGAQVALADVLLVTAVGAWLLAAAVRRAPAPMFKRNSMLAPCLLFVGINLASIMWSREPRDTMVFSIQLFEIIVLFPLVFASVTNSAAVMRRGLLMFIGATTVLALYSIVKYAPNIAAGDLQARDIGGGLNKNAVGSFVSAGLVAACTVWLGGIERRRTQTLLLAAIAIETAGLVATVSRASIIAAVVSVLFSSLMLKRSRLLTFGTVTLVATAYLLVVGVGSHADRRLAGSYDSSTVRTYSYRGGIRQIRERPLLGSGGGTYTDDIPQLGIVALPDPNNTFLLTWAEVGVGGILLFGFVLVRFGTLLARVRKLDPELSVPAVAGGCMALTVFVHSQFDVTWTRGTSSLAFAMMGWMMAAQRIAGEREAVPEPGTPPVLAPTVGRATAGSRALTA